MANTKSRKKISISMFEKIMKDTYISSKTVEWNGVEITIKPTLSFIEVLTFVDNVTKSCFSVEENTYLPEIKDFATKCCILEMYANFAMPSNIERKYDLVYCTDAVSTVMEHINIAQLKEIESAIKDKIDNITQSNIELINKQMNDLYAAFDNLQKQMSDIFSGIESGEITKLINAISNGGIDESKLVQAYIDQKNISDSTNDNGDE